MPTREEREYYARGFQDGARWFEENLPEAKLMTPQRGLSTVRGPKKRKLSAWNKYVKANSKKPRFRYRNGKLNLKKMAIAFRKTPAGRKKRR
jgi:hypothetical protein